MEWEEERCAVLAEPSDRTGQYRRSRQLRRQMSRAPEIPKPARGNRLRSMCVLCAEHREQHRAGVARIGRARWESQAERAGARFGKCSRTWENGKGHDLPL